MDVGGEVEQSEQPNANPQGINFSGKKSSLRKSESFRTKSHTNQSKVNFELKIDEEAETIDNSEMSDDLTGTLQLRMRSSKRRGSSKSSSFRQSRICISIAQKNLKPRGADSCFIYHHSYPVKLDRLVLALFFVVSSFVKCSNKQKKAAEIFVGQ